MNLDFVDSVEDLASDLNFMFYSALLIGACIAGLSIVDFWDCSGSKTVSVLNSQGEPVQVFEAKGRSIMLHVLGPGVTFETIRGDLIKLGHSNFSISDCKK
jgi:hypothetical protein